MDRLWAPWRGAHVAGALGDARHEGGDEGPDVFARIAAAPPEDDARNLVVWRGAHVFVVMNLYPYNTGHVLLLPYREVAAYEDLTVEEREEMAALTARVIRWCRQTLRPDGFNIGINQGLAGGAGIPRHLHQHVVPRWRGDTNFLPVIGATKVMMEDLQTTYRKLREAAVADAAADAATDRD